MHLDSRHIIKENSFTGNPYSFNIGSHLGHLPETSFADTGVGIKTIKKTIKDNSILRNGNPLLRGNKNEPGPKAFYSLGCAFLSTLLNT